MFLTRVTAAVILGLASSAPSRARNPTAEVERFNAALTDATRRMDNSAVLALWADDGVSIIANVKPVVGKQAIAAFLANATAPLTGARMLEFRMTCHDIRISGNLASEWCTEHQVVRLGNGQPDFNGYGKLAFVLRRSEDGVWKLVQETWTPGSADDEPRLP